MRKLLLLPFLPLPLSLVACAKTNQTFKVITVHDGDTFTLSNNKVVRLFGVDAPEVSNQYNEFKETDGLEKIYGYEATKFTSDFLQGNNIEYFHEANDMYGRDVARIEHANKDLGLELVRNGLARVAYISLDNKSPFYTNNFSYYQKLLLAQFSAYQNKLGFWLHEDQFKTIFPKA